MSKPCASGQIQHFERTTLSHLDGCGAEKFDQKNGNSTYPDNGRDTERHLSEIGRWNEHHDGLEGCETCPRRHSIK
jgi:hypothetical protein